MASGDRPEGERATGDRHFELLRGWTAMAVVALLACVGGTLVLALHTPKGSVPMGGCAAKDHVCPQEHRASVAPRHPQHPQQSPEDDGDLTLVINVAGSAVSPPALPATPPACPECPQSTKDGEAGARGSDLVVVVDRQEIRERLLDKETVVKVENVEKIETRKEVEQPPKACEEPVGRVRFEPGRCRVRFHRQEVLSIADQLQGRSGTVLVIGHPDPGNRERQGERRAKKVGKALRKALKGRSGTQLPVLTRAGSAHQASVGESGTCADVHYGTAGVYLIEGLS